MSNLLRKRGIKHVVLNAKYHAQEAEIVAQAGRKGTVTIATNMAGRGTDILLGGNPEFMARQQTLADQIADKLPKGQEKFVDDDEFVYFYHLETSIGCRARNTSASSRRSRSKQIPNTTTSSMWAALHIVATERHEARRARVALTAGAAAQLVVDAARLVALGADDVQAAERDDVFVLGVASAS